MHTTIDRSILMCMRYVTWGEFKGWGPKHDEITYTLMNTCMTPSERNASYYERIESRSSNTRYKRYVV